MNQPVSLEEFKRKCRLLVQQHKRAGMEQPKGGLSLIGAERNLGSFKAKGRGMSSLLAVRAGAKKRR